MDKDNKAGNVNEPGDIGKKQETQQEQEPRKPHAGAFNETATTDTKSTINVEEANQEQERKEAMRERD
ncbi:MAG TPA: hypothetical protein VFZ78_03360 [Flavisolibacter sp.]